MNLQVFVVKKMIIKLMQDAFLCFYFVSLRVRRKNKKLSLRPHDRRELLRSSTASNQRSLILVLLNFFSFRIKRNLCSFCGRLRQTIR